MQHPAHRPVHAREGALPEVNTGLARYTGDGSVEYLELGHVKADSSGATAVCLFAPYEPAQPLAAVAFLSDRKGNVLGEKVETTSHTFTDPCSAEALYA